MATLTDLSDRVGKRSLTDGTVVADLTATINDAYKDVCNKAALNPLSGSLPMTANVGSYVLTSTFAAFNGLLTVRFVGANLLLAPLEPTSLAVIEQHRGTTLATGIPQEYAVVGFDKLEIWPPPQTTGDSLFVWYLGTPTALAAGGDIPSLIPSEYHDVIELRAAVMRAARFESAGENAALKASLDAEFQQRMGELRAFIRRHQTDQPERLRVGYPRMTRMRPATPSTDVSSSNWRQ